MPNHPANGMTLPDRLLRAVLLVIGMLGVDVPPMVPAAAQSASGAPTRRRIVVFYDEDRHDYPGLSRIDRTLRESFQSAMGDSVEIHSESLDLSRFERPGYDVELADHFRRKYVGKRPDLLIAFLEPSLDFLLRYAGSLFPGVPIVFGGVDASAIVGKTLPDNVTGVLVKRVYSPTLDNVLRLQPETRSIVIVGGASTADRYLETLVRRDLQPYEGRVGLTYLSGLPMDEILKRVSSLPARTGILYVTTRVDGSGRRFIPHEALSAIAAAANAPVYVFLDQYVGLGAVGGNVYSFGTHGAQVAALGLQILRGASPARLPVREAAAQMDLFDARQLERWNLDETRLPPGSVVLNRDPSAWTLYRWYIMVGAAALVIQGAFITGLLLARARQRLAEAELRKVYVRLGTVEEDERRAFHRELHDQVGANLSALRLALDLTRDLLGRGDAPRAEQHVRNAQEVAQETIAAARNLMAELRPPALDDYGLAAALRACAESYTSRLNIEIEFTGNDLSPRLPPLVETALFRIALEALVNAATHASAKHVGIALTERAERVFLTVEDDGAGFVTGIPAEAGHWGLKNMDERARAIGARLNVKSAPGAGTRVRVELGRSTQ